MMNTEITINNSKITPVTIFIPFDKSINVVTVWFELVIFLHYLIY